MKKQLGFLCAAILALSNSALAAGTTPLGLSGLGVYSSLGLAAGSLGTGVGITAKWRNFPVVGLQYRIDHNLSRFNSSVDYFVLDGERLGPLFTYFLGVGAYGGCSVGQSVQDFDLGLRFPVGIQFWPIDLLEFYVSPVVAIPLYPSPAVWAGVEFGGRLHFRG